MYKNLKKIINFYLKSFLSFVWEIFYRLALVFLGVGIKKRVSSLELTLFYIPNLTKKIPKY